MLLVMQTLAGLTALTRLLLKSNSDDMTPGCSEPACLRHPTLRKLFVSFTQVPDVEDDLCTLLRYAETLVSGQVRAQVRGQDHSNCEGQSARTVLTAQWRPLRPHRFACGPQGQAAMM